jgi:hypothetical protein
MLRISLLRNTKVKRSSARQETESFPPNQVFDRRALARRQIFEDMTLYHNNRTSAQRMGLSLSPKCEKFLLEQSRKFFL